MAIKVINIKGTSDNKCNCGSWLDHWKKFSKKEIGQCREVACTTTAEVGAHVKREKDNDWFIIPLCQGHNKSNSSLNVIDATTFVPANKKETCEK